MTPCIEWEGARVSAGYGHGYRNGVHFYAHREAYERAFGPIPDGMCVCHRCDNPPCVNPDHLFVGTHGDNARDKEAKGRGIHPGVKGVKHPAAKLTESQVLDIRAANGTQRAIAARFGVSQVTVERIKNRKLWRHI